MVQLRRNIQEMSQDAQTRFRIVSQTRQLVSLVSQFVLWPQTSQSRFNWIVKLVILV